MQNKNKSTNRLSNPVKGASVTSILNGIMSADEQIFSHISIFAKTVTDGFTPTQKKLERKVC